jgi:hypothetical protein
MNFEAVESLMSIVCFYVLACFLCLQVYGVWSLQFNSMEMSFWVGFGDGAGLLPPLGWLLNEPCRSRCTRLVGVGKVRELRESRRKDKWRSSSHQKKLNFPFEIDVRKQKCVLEGILDSVSSVYGFGCRLGILRKPTNLTKFGRECICWIVGAMEKNGFPICYGWQVKN